MRRSSGPWLVGDLLSERAADWELTREQVAIYTKALQEQGFHTVSQLGALGDNVEFFRGLAVPLQIQSVLYRQRQSFVSHDGSVSGSAGASSPGLGDRLAPQLPRVPPVEVTVKVYSLSSINVREGVFHCHFNVMLDWEDESVVGQPKDTIQWNEHFVPQVDIENAKDELAPLGGMQPPRVEQRGPGCLWCKRTQVYKGELVCDGLRFNDFPFDVQRLPIKIKSKALARSGANRRLVRLVHPANLRPTMKDRHGFAEYGNGHVFAGGSQVEWAVSAIEGVSHSSIEVSLPPNYPAQELLDCFDHEAKGCVVETPSELLLDAGVFEEMILKSVDGTKVESLSQLEAMLKRDEAGRELLFQSTQRDDSYVVYIHLQRRWTNIAWNIIFPVFILISLAFVAFGSKIEALAERETVTFTLLLMCCTLKHLLHDVIPAVPYVTTLDAYIIYAMVCTWLNACEHVLVAIIFEYYSKGLAVYLDYAWVCLMSVGYVSIHHWLISRWKVMHSGGVKRMRNDKGVKQGGEAKQQHADTTTQMERESEIEKLRRRAEEAEEDAQMAVEAFEEIDQRLRAERAQRKRLDHELEEARTAAALAVASTRDLPTSSIGAEECLSAASPASSGKYSTTRFGSSVVIRCPENAIQQELEALRKQLDEQQLLTKRAEEQGRALLRRAEETHDVQLETKARLRAEGIRKTTRRSVALP
eukprot:Hpha_TRINITY_DN16423_c2_g1::TRINITY_DN16423_c2_g1_i2::g.162010::m.162010